MLSKILKKIFIFPVRMYQLILSPWLPNACRFHPTCSQYMIEAIQKYGVLKGGWLGIKRISRCHPWGKNGHDPVP
ncbi:MAG: membrane protein insertion efficiency factor YidD [Bacteroidetes bacterium]|nr:MAG: membrane protein insertion efficiency factor YidD [Bacteroidota bacterium]TAG86063.1 MAG: membrane protein insertion efficiency factor YidD [Bacteroidota bacterium]